MYVSEVAQTCLSVGFFNFITGSEEISIVKSFLDKLGLVVASISDNISSGFLAGGHLFGAGGRNKDLLDFLANTFL